MQYEEEEGEIIDDDESEFTDYVPHVRPELPQVCTKPDLVDITDEQYSSDEDRPAIRPPQVPAHPLSSFNIWQIDISEELCTSLNTSLGDLMCGPNDRDIESYSYRVNYDRSQLGPNRFDVDVKSFFATGSRRLAPLSVSESNSTEEIAKDICRKLKEKNRCLIYTAVEVMGKKKAISNYRKTRQIERKGGLLVKNRSRKRTSGGVFLYLIQQDRSITSKQIKEIFHEQKEFTGNFSKKKKKTKKKKKIFGSNNSLNNEDNDKFKMELKSRGEVELERLMRTPPASPAPRQVRTPPPSPSSPHPPALCTTSLLDQTSAALRHTDDMQVE